ncbi:hypothetical protein GCM10027046_17470 [Uliginosibacterium flavum]|uniref:Uncharacterized protein n=1 Tax=Uliginosibacterium flavum TaxID=1396831 RepID=A0ABV2TF75_9RHOO
MKKSVLEIYALAVCFVTLVCFAASMGIALKNTVRLLKPDFTITSDTYFKHQSNSAYNDSFIHRWDPEKPASTPDPAVLTAEREASYARVLDTEKREGLQTLIDALIIILIDIGIFGFHWRLARRAQTSTQIS